MLRETVWDMTDAERTVLANKIIGMIEKEATKRGFHNFMPRSVSIAHVADRSCLDLRVIYTFTYQNRNACLERNFGFSLEFRNSKTLSDMVDDAIEIIGQYHEDWKEEIFKEVI